MEENCCTSKKKTYREEEEKKQLQQELEKILNSTSWKVTKPLRYLSSKLRK